MVFAKISTVACYFVPGTLLVQACMDGICIVLVSDNKQGLKAKVEIVLTCRMSSGINCRRPALPHSPLHVGWHAWETCWHSTWHAPCSKGIGPWLPWLTPHVLHGCFHGLLHHLQYVHVMQKPEDLGMCTLA